MATEQGVEALAAFVAGRPQGDWHKGLFRAACRAAEEGLEPGPLIAAAEKVGLEQADAEQTIVKARAGHGTVHPQ
jgi:hypothetical protein